MREFFQDYLCWQHCWPLLTPLLRRKLFRSLDTSRNSSSFKGAALLGRAQSSAVAYSLIETAKETGLDPYRYLLWVLQSAPVLSRADETWAEKLGKRKI